MNRRSFVMKSLAAPVVASAAARPQVAVIGAGAFGGWTAFYLQQMGASVTLLDAYGPGNTRSSSGGETRLLRADYGDKVAYTKMALRAFKLWKHWQSEWGQRLLVPTGRLLLGKESAYAELEKRQKRLIAHGIPTELLDGDELKRRWPQIYTDDVPVGIYNPPEPSGSLLMAREACRAVASAFERGGGKFRIGRAVPGETVGGQLRSVRVDSSEEIRADAFVFACGPWLPKTFPALFETKLRVLRRDIFFIGPPAGDNRFSFPNLPTWGTLHEPWYGFPSVDGRGLKTCPTDEAKDFDPDTGERVANPEQIKRAHDYIGYRFPALKSQPIVESRVCQVTNSLKGDFVIDRHPELSNVWLAGAGSGHGFKHGPALGEYLAARMLRGTTNSELDPLFRFPAR
jgi:sarcosine oxidase